MKFFIELLEYEAKPKWYGLIYRYCHKDTYLACPIPFNILFRFLYEIYWWSVIGLFKTQRERYIKRLLKSNIIEKDIDSAINRVIKEWCCNCSHNLGCNCNFEEYKKHCSIANLINILRK